MPTIPNPKAIHTAYLSLPKSIKEWLSSENAGFLVGEINDRLGLENEKATVISLLVLRLATQDLDPLDFINELSHQLNVSFETAKSIAQDIEERVLRPIAGELRREVGVDAKLIFFGKPGSRNSQATLVQEMPRPTPPPANQPTFVPAPPMPESTQKSDNMRKSDLQNIEPQSWEIGLPKVKAPPPVPPPAPKEEPTTPFMLHQETIPLEAAHPLVLRTASARAVPLTGPTTPSTNSGQTSPKPPTIKLETPPVRVVHYNDLRTPLSAIGTPKKIDDNNTVDLRKR